MKVFDLQFTSREALLEGFRRAQDRAAVDSCSLELDELRLRFFAPRLEAEELAHQIYLGGGLRWCSGHEIASERGGEAGR